LRPAGREPKDALAIRLPGRGVSPLPAPPRLPGARQRLSRGSYEATAEKRWRKAGGGERRRRASDRSPGQARRQGTYTWENGARLEGTLRPAADGPGAQRPRHPSRSVDNGAQRCETRGLSRDAGTAQLLSSISLPSARAAQ
jgi:hypothetical protein